PHKNITNVNQDSGGNFWISTDNGLSIFDKNHQELHLSKFPSPPNQQKNANRIVGTIEISEGTSWVVTWNGIYLYSIKNKEISQPQSMKLFQRDKFNLLSYSTDDKNIWLGTTNGIYLFGLANKKLTKIVSNSPLDDSNIHRLEKIGAYIYAISSKGLFKLETPNDEDSSEKILVKIQLVTTQVSTEEITDFVRLGKLDEMEILFSTKNSIFSFDTNSGTIKKLFSLHDVLPNTSTYQIKTLYVDKQNLLWIGTLSNGAYLWNTHSKNFAMFNSKMLNEKFKINANNVWSIDRDKLGNYWVGSDKGLNYIDSKSLTATIPFNFDWTKIPEKQAKVHDVFLQEDFIWMATADGLNSLDVKNQTFAHFRPPWFNQDEKFIIFSITSIDKNILWLATNVGILKFNSSTKLFEFENIWREKNDKKMIRYITHINGQILTASENDFVIYNPNTGLKKSLLKSQQNKKGQYYSLTDILYINNQLWLSYNGDGIYIIEDSSINTLLSPENSSNSAQPPQGFDKVTHLDKTNNFPNTVVYSLEYSNGFVWASTNIGLVRIDPKKLSNSIYDYSFGLTINEFNEGASLLTDNRLIYGGTNGLAIIDPSLLANLNVELQTPKITQIKLTEQGKEEIVTFPNNATPSLILSENTLLTVQFALLDYRDATNWEFEYWFEGKEHLLKRKTIRPELSISNLASGNYSLRIKASSKYHINESKSLKIELLVKDEHFFEAKVSLLIFVATFMSFLLLVFLFFRKNKLLKQQLEVVVEEEKRLEHVLLDKNRGIWELSNTNKNNKELTVFQESRSPMELSLNRYFDFVHEDDVEKIKSIWLEFSSGKVSVISETYRVYFHGELIWNYIHGKVVARDDNGNPTKSSGIWVNVDKEKKVEKRLHLYSHAFESTLDIVFILDNDLSIVAVNQAYEILTGFSCEQMIGRSMVEVAFSRFTAIETNEIKNKVIRNKRWKGASSVPRRNASSFPVDIRINLISKDGMDNGYVVVMSDISDSRNTRSENFGSRFYDQVTGLSNKVLAFDRLRQIIKRSEENKTSFSLILLSVENIEKLKKQFNNDTIADLFRELSARILPFIDREDLLGKFDETRFIVILRHRQQDEEMLSTINHLMSECLKPTQLNRVNYHIPIHAGISKYPDDSKNWSELVTKAQLALEKTNQNAGTHLSYFQESQNLRALERRRIENRLSNAIEKDELFLVFQPIIDLNDHFMLNAEASFRWQMKKDQVIYPAQILTIATEIEMLTKITNWLINNTLASLNRWNQEDLHITLNLNLSTEYLLSNSNLDYISDTILSNDINPADLIISLNEDFVFANQTKLQKAVRRLKAMGVSLMLSDFGKDNAPIQKITQLNFSAVRFDKSLIRRIGKDEFSESLIKNMSDVISGLGITCMANGMENEKQEAFLLKHNCSLGQGFLYSDPLTENQMRQLMLNKEV
ncbi:MAG: EAL domain-containing protein, partial [Kangiellaceae bacterium]